MARQDHIGFESATGYCRPVKHSFEVSPTMQYLPLFLLFMAVLIAAYFYLERAKKRDAGHGDAPKAPGPDSTSAPR